MNWIYVFIWWKEYGKVVYLFYVMYKNIKKIFTLYSPFLFGEIEEKWNLKKKPFGIIVSEQQRRNWNAIYI